MHVHVILCNLLPNEHGLVDVSFFLRVCCSLIPRLFDCAKFMEQYNTIAKEKAEAQAEQELKELEEFAGRAVQKTEEENEEDEKAPDREAVEKALIQECEKRSMRQMTSFGRGDAAITLTMFQQAMKSEGCRAQLSEPEMRGFLAEAVLDYVESDDGPVPVVSYLEHVKTWIPLIFLLRRSRVYEQLLNQEWSPLEEEEHARRSSGPES